MLIKFKLKRACFDRIGKPLNIGGKSEHFLTHLYFNALPSRVLQVKPLPRKEAHTGNVSEFFILNVSKKFKCFFQNLMVVHTFLVAITFLYSFDKYFLSINAIKALPSCISLASASCSIFIWLASS